MPRKFRFELDTSVSHVRIDNSNWLVDIIYSLFSSVDESHFCLQLVMRSHKTVRLHQSVRLH